MMRITGRWGHRAGLAVALTMLVVTTVSGTGAASPDRSDGRTPGWGARPAEDAGEPLRILLTNDDGYDAPGIEAVRQALEAANHEVTVVAPASNASGSSARLTLDFGSRLTVTRPADDVYAVEGTPADAVAFGLDQVYADEPPDLVVSGSNFGQNAGGVALHSGTVGAATTAIRAGVPAVAVSTEIDLQAGQEATLAAFPDTADLVVEVIDTLRASQGRGALLPAGRGLNLNYPIVGDGTGEPAGVAFTQIGSHTFVEPAYRPAGDDTYVITPVFPDFEEPVPFADTTALAEDRVSIGVLDGDLGVGLRDGGRIFLRLWPLR